MLKLKKRFPISMVVCLCLVVLVACSAPAQTPLKSVNSPEGGRIMYGVVDGVTTQAGGMASVLRAVHSNCGERPQIGRVFKFRGTETVGVFFTVVNHPAGNVKVAGLVVAAMNGSQRVEAALVSDDASRFGNTVNPMLKELFDEWHPGGSARAANASSGRSSAPAPGSATGGHSTAVLPMHKVTLQDNTASANLPDGWQLARNSGGGTIVIVGPHQEGVALNTSTHQFWPRTPLIQASSAPGGWATGRCRARPSFPTTGIL